MRWWLTFRFGTVRCSFYFDFRIIRCPYDESDDDSEPYRERMTRARAARFGVFASDPANRRRERVCRGTGESGERRSIANHLVSQTYDPSLLARRAVAFQLAARAGAAVRAAAFQPTMRAGVAVRAPAFQLAMRTGVAVRAVAFQPTMRAGVAVRAVVFHLPMRAGVAVRAHAFPLAMWAGVAGRAVVVQPAVRAPLSFPHRSRSSASSDLRAHPPLRGSARAARRRSFFRGGHSHFDSSSSTRATFFPRDEKKRTLANCRSQRARAR